MDHNTDKQIEKLVDKIMTETTLESPSFDFTNKVMAQIVDLKTSQVTAYKPLISKWVWYAIFVSVLGLVVYLYLKGVSSSAPGLFESLNLKAFLRFNISTVFGYFQFSKNTIYAVVLLTFMLFVQIPILKHYINKRLEA